MLHQVGARSRWLAVLVVVASAPAHSTTIGPISLVANNNYGQPHVTLYVVAENNGTATVAVKRGSSAMDDRVLIRAWDPSEQLVTWVYADTQVNRLLEATSFVGDAPYIGTYTDTNLTPQGPLEDAAIPLVRSIPLVTGVNEIRIKAGEMKCDVNVTLPDGAGYGISFQHGSYANWTGQPSTLFAYAPRHPTARMRLTVNHNRLARALDTNVTIVAVDTNTTLASSDLWTTPGSGGVLWRFDLPAKWNFTATGFPLILANTQAAAQSIAASLVSLPGSRIGSFKFQARMAALVDALLTDVGDARQLRARQWLFRQQSRLHRPGR